MSDQAHALSREEWAIRINAFAHAYEMLKSSLRLDKRENPDVWAERMRAREVSILDAIMSLQAEVEALMAEVVSLQNRTLGEVMAAQFSRISAQQIEKARQPK